MEWIKTSEKLPPFDQKVLVVYKDKYNQRNDYEYYTGWIFSPDPLEKLSFNLGYCGSAEMDEIIYWMPIPSLPNDERIK